MITDINLLMNRIFSTALLLTLLTYFKTASAQTVDNVNFKNIEDKVLAWIDEGRLPSVGVAVSYREKVIYQKAFGYAHREDSTLASVHTAYQMASITKPMTATAIARLYADDKLDISDSLAEWLPEALPQSQPHPSPALYQLLNHTSGLGTYFNITYPDRNQHAMSLMDAAHRYGQLHHPAGTLSEYSNLGYGLLDQVVAKASGMTYAKYMQHQVFDALGMNDSFITSPDTSLELAQKYTKQGQPIGQIGLNTPGAGSAYSSIADLLKFGQAHLHQDTHLLPASYYNDMQQNHDTTALYPMYEDGTYYGLGWYVRPTTDQSSQVVWHEGGMTGAATMLKLFPSKGLAIAMVTNVFDNQALRELTYDIEALFLEESEVFEINETAAFQQLGTNDEWEGEWQGTVQLGEESIDLELTIDEGQATLDIHTSEGMPSRDVYFTLTRENFLLLTASGLLPIEGLTEDYPGVIQLKLVCTGEGMRGTLSVLAIDEREYFAYPYGVKLHKK